MSLPATPQSSSREFISPGDEAGVFQRMRRRILTTVAWQTLSQSRFRVALVAVLTMMLWSSMFWMFTDGFGFLKTIIPDRDTHARTISAVFGTFFAALMVMLVFSSGIILYGSLFCSRETAFLLTTPARTERVFLHKFQEALLLSSWGFVLLGSPILLAYGVVAHASWYYYVMLLPYLLAFIYIPIAIGAIICLAVMRHIPDGRMAVLVGGGLIFLAAGVWLAWSTLCASENDLLTSDWFQRVLGRLPFSERRLLPSWWLSSGLLSASSGAWSDSLLFLTLMISNALFFRQLACWTAHRMFRASYSELYGRSLRRRRARSWRFDYGVSAALAFLPATVRLLILKDLRLFRRDPLQWSQFLIFLGLLALYFLNIRRFVSGVYYAGWVNMISFLNLAVVGLLLSTFMTRFIFPLISLEGRRFWVLGLLPVRRDTILWSKLLFAVGGSIIPCTILVLLSDGILGVSKLVAVSHQMTCVLLCLGLSGIAVGLGARFPNFREQSPSRIAAGFGGTLNLVVSTLYILTIVLLTAVPTHFYLAAHDSTAGSARVEKFAANIDKQADVQWMARYPAVSVRVAQPSDVQRWLELWLGIGTLGSILLGAIATGVPLFVGFRAFRRMDF
jgi:ABC-2 type transport system permease protein